VKDSKVTQYQKMREQLVTAKGKPAPVVAKPKRSSKGHAVTAWLDDNELADLELLRAGFEGPRPSRSATIKWLIKNAGCHVNS